LADVERADFSDELWRVFGSVGGVDRNAPIRPGRWDLEFDGVMVELDEILHFNRYRMVTLASPVYASLSKFPRHQYRDFCSDYEAECASIGRVGGRWTNASCERQFGPAGPRGDLSGAGAPRWRQRAFYDFVKDLAPLALGVRMARISIYDELQDARGLRSVAEILDAPAHDSGAALASLIRQRAGQA
jgi:hypothetical protein